jgi:hypothetical protein
MLFYISVRLLGEENQMLRAMLSAVLLGMTAMPVSTEGNCGKAYLSFVERLSHREQAMSGDRIAALHRSALRILDACDTGHMDNSEPMFRKLEDS